VSFFPASGRVGSQVCSADPGSALDQIEQPGGATRGEVDDAGGELGGALDPAPLPGMLIDPDRGDGIEPGRVLDLGAAQRRTCRRIVCQDRPLTSQLHDGEPYWQGAN